MAPTKLLNDHVSVDKDLADVDRVVPALLVIRHSFIFTGVAIFEKRLVQLLFQGGEVTVILFLFLAIIAQGEHQRLILLLLSAHLGRV